MAEKSNIEWCDSTFNPWVGCTKVGPGCDHCYAEKRMDTRLHVVNWGAGNPRKRTSAANWKEPMRWNAKPFYECSACGWRGDDPLPSGIDGVHSCPSDSLGCQAVVRPARRRVFCASLADWLDNEVPIEWLCDLLDLIRKTPNLDWLLLTKRIGNWRARLIEVIARVTGWDENPREDLKQWVQDWVNGKPPANVWIGATIVNQFEADRDIPKLLRIPARVRFLSMEPLLGPVDVSPYLRHNPVHEEQAQRGVRVPGGAIRRLGDSSGRDDLAAAQARLGPLEENGSEPTLYEEASRARLRGISAGSGDVGWQAGVCIGAPSGVAALQRADSRPADDQPLGRAEEAQQPGQSGVGNTLGATDPRDARAEGGACLQSGRGEQQHGEVDRGRSGNDSSTQRSRGEAGTDSGVVRGYLSDHIENMPKDSASFWIIAGGESGPRARLTSPDWARSLRDQCAAAGVPFLWKQWGEWLPAGQKAACPPPIMSRKLQLQHEKDGKFSIVDGHPFWRVGKKAAGRLLDGVEHNGFPSVAA